MFVFLVSAILYPNGTLAKATKTCPAAKRYWRPLNSKRSLPVLKWSSESEYFLSFNFFLQITWNRWHFLPDSTVNGRVSLPHSPYHIFCTVV